MWAVGAECAVEVDGTTWALVTMAGLGRTVVLAMDRELMRVQCS